MRGADLIPLTLDFLFLGVLLFLAIGTALAVFRTLRVRLSASDTLALGLPLGLGLMSLIFLAVGQVGRLDRLALGVAGCGLGGLALHEWWRVLQRLEPGSIWLKIQSFFRLPAFSMVVIALIASATLLGTRAPVTDGDALCYHLQVPKVFLAAHQLTFEPDLHETVYPLLVENLFGIGLVFRGPVACRLISWSLGLALACGVGAMAGRWIGTRAVWASAMILAVPAISNGMTAPLNDVALATWCQATMLACLVWWERPTSTSAALAGILAGLSLGVKYPALVWVALLGLLMVAIVLRARWLHFGTINDRLRGPAPIDVLIFAALCLLMGGVWYLRAYLTTGNPVYPFFKAFFGGSGLDVVLEPAKRPLQVTAWNLLTALVPMTLDPDRFDSLSHQFGPIFLMLLPGMLLFRAPRRLQILVLVAWPFYLACLTQRQSMRFLLATLAPWSVGTAWVLCRVQDSWGRVARWATFLVVLVLVAETGLAVSRVRHVWPILLGQEDTAAYLSRREPTYVVGQWMARNLPESARIIGQDHRGFYIPRSYTMELAHRRRTGLGRSGESAEQMLSTLRRRGFTHLLMCPPVPEDAVEFDPWLSRALKPWLDQQTPVFEAPLADGDGVLRKYALYELPKLSGQTEFVEPVHE